jgi:hypothetical protein
MLTSRRRASRIVGCTALPAGFAHPHASQEARQIAEAGMILRVQVGSGVHGTSISGQDDRDEMGLCLEPPQFVTGLACGRSRSTDSISPGLKPDHSTGMKLDLTDDLARL